MNEVLLRVFNMDGLIITDALLDELHLTATDVSSALGLNPKALSSL